MSVVESNQNRCIDTSARISGENRPYELDILKIHLDEDGAVDFYWPVSYYERTQFSMKLMQRYVDLMHKRFRETIDGAPYKLLAKYLFFEVVTVFQAELSRKRFVDSGREPLPPLRWRTWPKLFAQDSLSELPILPTLRQPPIPAKYRNKVSLFRRCARKVKAALLRRGPVIVNGIVYREITTELLKTCIVATRTTELITEHAQSVSCPVLYGDAYEWFESINESAYHQSVSRNDKATQQSILRIIQDLYQEYGISLTEVSRQHFEDIIVDGAALLRVHLDRLVSKPDALPRTLWTGSGGNIWDMMLRLAVLENGGVVVGHDHGGGAGHVKSPIMGLVEFWGCTDFMTFNSNHALELNANTPPWLFLSKNTPKIVGPENRSEDRFITYPKFLDKNYRGKKLYYMATLFDGDRGRIGEGYADIFLIDWQVRLLSRLKRWGYDVTYKLHPESPILPPRYIEKDLAIPVVTERFERIIDHADVVIFGCIYTSSFRTAISTNIPIVIIDFVGCAWTEKAKDLISKRCAFVKARYDENNRAQLDEWDSMKRGLEEAGEKCNNREFFNYYYA